MDGSFAAAYDRLTFFKEKTFSMRSILSGLATAAAVLLLVTPWNPAMADDDAYAERAREILPRTMEIDGGAASALAARSLPDLQAVFEQLQEENVKTETLVTSGGTASACDVSHWQLMILVGFSINKLGGEGRYREWMEDENLTLLASYRELIGACGDDAGSPATSGITDEMIKAM